jgi:hypothetical protein
MTRTKDVDSCLVLLSDWAKDKVRAGREPPWAWYQYMKLVEAVDAIRQGRGRVRQVEEGSHEPARTREASDSTTRVEDAESGNAQRRRNDDDSEPLPM